MSIEEFIKSDTSLLKKFRVFCHRCKLTTVVLAEKELHIKAHWVCSCGSTNFIIMSEKGGD